ncbi:1-acyl-sn-glycerol-3-phosphate acyltransferase [Cryobacterium sp. TMT1-3]|uniref:1-acyl-sn-glycerol-3-phosphate acyltransferase n=1 Tax=Cryobacterium luteum TaxID=1424661 RepID=A0A1H8GRI0_9MICO|nr:MULTISPECIES: lysophospholipid acyltransferase family protein [Cryobacterium]TFB84629.1 1-acyl-sn-glycerol-3-phosphate acyltransferase [Cryobacterium luteum]TFC28421.1 1-acyl-sn-glycerol-3-phosphate acyltransferase [Cryobacterium sp. TMT1-3]SEN46097.1 1-acyl-sn-glycerol-3-phosphate acyltransferases [Cryobacterium luteum]
MHKREPIYQVAIGAGRALFGVLRVRPAVTGLERLPVSGGAVLAITHFGYLDFALVEWVTWRHNRRHIRFMAKKGAFDQPLVGPLLRGMKHISVDMDSGHEAYAQAVTALVSGELLGVFPEGGVNASFTVRELKSGAVRMAQAANVPIIPVAVWGGHRLMTKNHRSRLRERMGVPVSIRFGEPIRADAAAAVDDVAAATLRLHDTLQRLVDAVQTEYPVPGAGQWWQPAHLGGTAPTPEQAAIAEAERRRRKAAAKSAAEK